jgi:hypothetical protein
VVCQDFAQGRFAGAAVPQKGTRQPLSKERLRFRKSQG